MNPLSTAELASMRATDAETRLDTCQLGTVVVTQSGARTKQTPSWGAEIACGFTAGGGAESKDGAQTPENAASVVLPVTVSVDQTTLVRLVSKCKLVLAVPEVYKVIGAPQYGMTGLVLRLERLTAGGIG